MVLKNVDGTLALETVVRTENPWQPSEAPGWFQITLSEDGRPAAETQGAIMFQLDSGGNIINANIQSFDSSLINLRCEVVQPGAAFPIDDIEAKREADYKLQYPEIIPEKYIRLWQAIGNFLGRTQDRFNDVIDRLFGYGEPNPQNNYLTCEGLWAE